MGEEKEKNKWLKIDEKFFHSHGNLINRDNGAAYLGIYLNLLGLALKNDGIIFLALKANLLDSVSSLVNCLDKSLVRKCLLILERYGYIEKLENRQLFFHEVKEIMQTETLAAARMRKCRENKLNSSKRNIVTNERNNVTRPLQNVLPYKNKNFNIPRTSTTYRPCKSDSCPNNVALGPSSSYKSSRSTKNKEIVFNNKEPSTYTAEQMFQEIEGESTPRKE